MNHTRSHRLVIIWLLTGCILIAAMVVIGGITRLTQSGLSIVEWNLIGGTIAPATETEWQEEFSKYQQSPQFKLINRDFTLDDFKSIYWWEYIHRLLGRIIGVVFIVPFLLFWWKGFLNRELIKKLLIIFVLGALQGALGWFMVKSGLVNEPHVSHYRLAAHLITAFITFGYSLHVALTLIKSKPIPISPLFFRIFYILFVLLGIQILFGAFVAGKRAGYYFNTWPDMDGKLIPDSGITAWNQMGISAITEDVTLLQFIHRALAYLIYGMVIYFLISSKSNKKEFSFSLILFGLTTLQVLLGIFTLIAAVPVWLGVLHQLGAFLIFAWCVYINQRTKLV